MRINEDDGFGCGDDVFATVNQAGLQKVGCKELEIHILCNDVLDNTREFNHLCFMIVFLIDVMQKVFYHL